MLERNIPDGAGFALILFDFGEGGSMSYISNANLGDMLKAMKGILEKPGAN